MSSSNSDALLGFNSSNSSLLYSWPIPSWILHLPCLRSRPAAKLHLSYLWFRIGNNETTWIEKIEQSLALGLSRPTVNSNLSYFKWWDLLAEFVDENDKHHFIKGPAGLEAEARYKDKRYLKVEGLIAACTKLMDSAKLVFSCIQDHQGANATSWVSQKTIGRELSLGQSAIKCGVKQLQRLGLIAVERGLWKHSINQCSVGDTYNQLLGAWQVANSDIRKAAYQVYRASSNAILEGCSMATGQESSHVEGRKRTDPKGVKEPTLRCKRTDPKGVKEPTLERIQGNENKETETKGNENKEGGWRHPEGLRKQRLKLDNYVGESPEDLLWSIRVGLGPNIDATGLTNEGLREILRKVNTGLVNLAQAKDETVLEQRQAYTQFLRQLLSTASKKRTAISLVDLEVWQRAFPEYSFSRPPWVETGSFCC